MSEHICARCAHCQKTCCQETDIYVSLGDLRRIEQFTGRADFTEFRAASDPVYREVDGDPLWQACVFRDDGTKRVLKHHAGGDCTFLGERGCSLPTEVRPLICRLYPFDYDAGGIRDELASGCPTHLLASDETLPQAIGMSRTDAERWHRMLYQEIQMESAAPATLCTLD